MIKGREISNSGLPPASLIFSPITYRTAKRACSRDGGRTVNSSLTMLPGMAIPMVYRKRCCAIPYVTRKYPNYDQDNSCAGDTCMHHSLPTTYERSAGKAPALL